MGRIRHSTVADDKVGKMDHDLPTCHSDGHMHSMGTHEADQILRKPAHAEDIVPGMVMRGIGAKT